MAYRYPYGNTEQMNLDWFLNQWEKFKADWAEAEAGIDGSLDAEIAKVEAAMSELYAARDAAAASASAARQSSLDAAAAQVAAGNSKTAAQAAETSARGSQQAAAQSAQEAQASAQGAENSALTASQAANTATQQAAGADAAKSAAEAAQAAAAQSAGQAGQAATAAGDHADDAADSATLAQQAAQDMSDSVAQITTNKNDISDLKESIRKSKIEDIPAIEDKLNKVSGYNLYDSREKEIGVINQDGTITYNTSYITTGLIPVTPGYKIRSAYKTEGGVYDANISRVLLFDESLQIISLSINVGTYIYELPNNAYYVRVTVSASVEPTLMIICDAEPQKPTSYEPYTNYFEATYTFIKTAINPLIINTIAPVLDDMTTDTALSVNDFRIVNNTLYRITSPVVSGGTLTPNTNCTATTITEILKTLLS